MNPVYANLPTTVFEVMSQLAREHNAINLGQGFPDDPGPEDVRRKAAEAVLDGYNQYPPMLGLVELREAIARHYAHWHRLSLDPQTEIMVTSGATEAVASSLFGLIEPGDEVVVFAPAYDAYLPLVRRAGGILRIVRLQPPEWRLTEEALRGVFSHKTKLVVFNSPQNPAAVVSPREDLELLARFCQEFDAYAVCDEVWEHVLFDGREHIPLITLPGMRERTVKIGSAGKDLLAHRLEGRFCLRGAENSARARQGAPVSHFHHTAEPAGGGRLRSRQGRRLFYGHARRSAAQPRPAGERPHLDRLSGAAGAGYVFSKRRPEAARVE